METTFGADFSHVRLHDGRAAAASAQEVGARAYTVGQHIVFAPGENHLSGTRARALLAHELAHVVQQGAGPESSNLIRIGSIGSAAEREADTASRHAVAGLRVRVSPASNGGMALLQRADDGGPGEPRQPIAEGDRISPGEALTRTRRLLKARTAGGREDVRDFKMMRDEAYFTGVVSDALGSLTHDVTPATLGDYDHVDAMVDEAVGAGRRLQWPTCGRLLSEAATELQRLERKMGEAREGAEAGAQRGVDLLHMVQGVCALIAAAPVGAAAGFAVAGEAAATAGVFSTAGVATASATGGVMAGYGMLNETAEQLATRGAVDLEAVAQRGLIEFVGTFFGHFANGVLTKCLGDWLVRCVSRELVASGLPARALFEGEQFAVEVLSGALATPFTAALGTVTARFVGDSPWPTPEQFVEQVMLEIPKGVLMSVLMQGAPRSTAPVAANSRLAGEGRPSVTLGNRARGMLAALTLGIQRGSPNRVGGGSYEPTVFVRSSTAQEGFIKSRSSEPTALSQSSPLDDSHPPLVPSGKHVDVAPAPNRSAFEFNPSGPLAAADEHLVLESLREGSTPEFDTSRPLLGDPAEQVDVGLAPAGPRLKPSKSKKNLEQFGKAYERTFGEPSEFSSGTRRRIGMHFNELNEAESVYGLITDYNTTAGRPNRVEYRVVAGTSDRVVETDRAFTRHDATEGAQATTDEYTGTGFDRGHLAQREAFKGNRAAEYAADQMPNIVPMHPNLNRGPGSPWRAAEAETIRFADQYGSVTVEVTPIYDANPPRLYPNGPPIPKAFTRQVVAPDGTVLRSSSFFNR